MEKMEKFIFQPDTAILRGIKIKKDTKLEFEKELPETGQKINQKVENLRMITNIETNKENKLTKSEIIIDFLEGDILIFDENYGYCTPATNVCTIDEAFETLEAQKDLIEKNMKGE